MCDDFALVRSRCSSNDGERCEKSTLTDPTDAGAADDGVYGLSPDVRLNPEPIARDPKSIHVFFLLSLKLGDTVTGSRREIIL